MVALPPCARGSLRVWGVISPVGESHEAHARFRDQPHGTSPGGSPRTPMTRVERLERWADPLDHEPDRVLTSIEEIEWKPEAERGDMHAESSALTVAFEARLLRAEGLASARLGDAVTFFRLTDDEAHF